MIWHSICPIDPRPGEPTRESDWPSRGQFHEPPRETRTLPGDLWRAVRRAFIGEPRGGCPLSVAERAALLEDVCVALRAGRLDGAQSILDAAWERVAVDASCLNLRGVIAEARGAGRLAKRFYGRGIRADGSFAPARQNMRRLYELHTFGRSDVPASVGHPLTDLFLARLARRGHHK